MKTIEIMQPTGGKIEIEFTDNELDDIRDFVFAYATDTLINSEVVQVKDILAKKHKTLALIALNSSVDNLYNLLEPLF